MALNPAKFAREVRQEAKRVIWPTRRETMISTAMVMVLALVASVFFVVMDSLIGLIVQRVLGIGG